MRTARFDAATRAVSSPLLEDASVDGARGVIVNVTGGADLSMLEVSEAASIIHEAAHEEANIIFGAVVDETMNGQVKITVIATGFGEKSASAHAKTPVELQHYTDWQQDQPMPQAVGAQVPLGRRPTIEIPPTPSPAPDGAENTDRIELDMSLDTPAFLRRQNG